jgi:hypothetical protein
MSQSNQGFSKNSSIALFFRRCHRGGGRRSHEELICDSRGSYRPLEEGEDARAKFVWI